MRSIPSHNNEDLKLPPLPGNNLRNSN